jgi:hypothetical protein
MKKLIFGATLCLLALPVLGEGLPTTIHWSGWLVWSTESLYLGRKHSLFPMTYPFDGNPATTWVFSGTGKHAEYEDKGYALDIERDPDKKAVMMDSIWIMNGYNKSRELFLRNNRIVQLKLYVNEKFLKTVRLSDSMGWHRISIPRQRVRDIKLQFTKFARGRDNDVCMSEIALYDKGRKIDLKMPKAVEFSEGDCPDAADNLFSLIDRSGTSLAEYDIMANPTWSPNGRYFAFADEELSVADTSIPKVILRKRLSKNKTVELGGPKWRGNSSVSVTTYKHFPDSTALGGFKEVEKTWVFRIPGS